MKTRFVAAAAVVVVRVLLLLSGRSGGNWESAYLTCIVWALCTVTQAPYHTPISDQHSAAGDLSVHNIVSNKARLKLADLDASLPIGEKLRQARYTEAYAPPEFMNMILKTRRSSGRVDYQVVSPCWFSHCLFDNTSHCPLAISRQQLAIKL